MCFQGLLPKLWAGLPAWDREVSSPCCREAAGLAEQQNAFRLNPGTTVELLQY